MIKVIDVFAGPGGMGEGFAAHHKQRNGQKFELAISIEKDALAHRTLRLRAFRRQFDGRLPEAYFRYLSEGQDWKMLSDARPEEARRASQEAVMLELAPGSVPEVRTRIADALKNTDHWVLIGGPPCQAYSLVGRARNRGNRGYVAERDQRQTLYVEYLQILADHAPPVFVMENVKGLLSAKLDSKDLFERIRSDLNDPASALAREKRDTGRRRPRYELRALVADDSLADDDPRRFVIHSERFGVPQRRHRVILVGVRTDLASIPLPSLIPMDESVSVSEALRDLPRLRSGLSKRTDSDAKWLESLRGVCGRSWLQKADDDVQAEIRRTIRALAVPRSSRGSEVLKLKGEDFLFNHSTRGHMPSDLERYLFSSCFARVRLRSPVMAEFPSGLRPNHANVRGLAQDTPFADRFRTQLAGQPATTVTSHISKDGHYYIHPDASQCRSLTVREAARLQTFPDDYFFTGPRTAQYHQVGNAVPPLLAMKIAKAIAAMF